MVRRVKQKTTKHSPHAEITINKNRLTKYTYNNVFMNDGDEFEIELDNNTTEMWMAKIWLNDELMSPTGIILRPGEHVYLDCNPDTHKKFVFSTYEVDKDRKEAIKNNGKVKVEFYRKNTNPLNYILNWITVPYVPPRPPWYQYYTYDSNSFPMTGSSGTYSHRNYSSNASFSTGNSIETGRVEEGNHSKQEFSNVFESFESFSSHQIEYQIFPYSQREYITKNEIKRYCSNCGRKKRKGDNFCPKCGTKL